MNPQHIAWQDGEERVQRWIERWAAGNDASRVELLHQTPQRILHRLEANDELVLDSKGSASIRSVVTKVHRTHSGAHRQRESIKRMIGYSPASREWQALSVLHSLDVPVPEPLAWGILPNRDPILVTEYLAGRNLATLLTGSTDRDRLDWIDRLAESIMSFHASGFRHGDLHLGNLHVRDDQVMILDLQRARRAHGRREQLRDLAQLDFSIARFGFHIDLRRRLRKRLDPPSGLDAIARRFVRDFLRGRSRRNLRIGDAWKRWSSSDPRLATTLQGLRDTHTSPSQIDRIVAAAKTDSRPTTRRGGRTRISLFDIDSVSFVIKRTATVSRRRALRDGFRGSAARRGFHNGQRLALLGPLGSRSLMAAEENAPGSPIVSWLILESVGRCDLDRYRPESEEASRCCSIALARWIAEWQVWGIDHLDLKASNIRIDDATGSFQFWLIDLEDIRFRRRLSDRARLRALVQLNASLDDESFSPAARKAGLDAYLDRMPFKRRNRAALIATIAARSLARAHRWRGRGCEASKASIL